MDTIYALATARGKAGVAVFRLSGSKAWAVAEALGGKLPAARQASLRKLRDRAGLLLDEALVLLFEEGRSFTGEQVAEFHIHGSQATVNAVLRALSAEEGLRIAEAGEFTRRALENGCLDLAQVEGLADLIEAETEAQRRQALRVLSGAIGKRAQEWRIKLIRASALLQATIDFADEDVPADVGPEVSSLLGSVIQDLKRELDGSKASERIRDGFEVAIVGRPNVGKSTLLNYLAGREAAITSEHAGTTRDVIEVRMDLSGLPVTFLDTAGLRETKDAVEEIGIKRAVERARSADIRIFLLDDEGTADGLCPGHDDLVVRGKCDLAGERQRGVSGKTGEGVAELVEAITERLLRITAGASTLTRERQRVSIESALLALQSADSEISKVASYVEIAAEDIRVAVHALDALVGRVDVEQVLDEIFSSFCIGK